MLAQVHAHTHTYVHKRAHTHAHTHTHTHTYTHAHTQTRAHTCIQTRTGPACAQMLVEAGGKDLLMLTNYSGRNCLDIAAGNGHVDMGKVL